MQGGRLLGVQEVPGSNPGGPTKRFKHLGTWTFCPGVLESTLESKIGTSRGISRRSPRPHVITMLFSGPLYSL